MPRRGPAATSATAFVHGASATPRVAFVVPRYGPDVLGGAETLCRTMAENLRAHGGDVEVLTTCATDHFTWQNSLPAGTEEIGGVPVHRFPVSARSQERWWNLHVRVALGELLSYEEQLKWMANSVWSAPLADAASDSRRYDWVVAIPYLFGTTFWINAERPDRTALIPCLHDEPYANLDVVRRMLSSCAGCMANTRGEEDILHDLAPSARTRVVGVGFDRAAPPPTERVEAFCRSRGISPGYLLYAGRREEAKGLPMLFTNYERYARARSSPPHLALMGTGTMPVPDELEDMVVDLGFVPDEERDLAYAGASVLVHPSELESLGMVLMESWQAGTPVLVNGNSPILTAHCQASGGGLWFKSLEEFSETLDLLLSDPELRRRFAAAGADYVHGEYSWETVRERFSSALDEWAA